MARWTRFLSLVTILAGPLACHKTTMDPQPTEQFAPAASPMVGNVRIDGDSSVCFTDFSGTNCDDGKLSKGESVNTLEGSSARSGSLGRDIAAPRSSPALMS